MTKNEALVEYERLHKSARHITTSFLAGNPMKSKEERLKEFKRLMEDTSELETTLLAGSRRPWTPRCLNPEHNPYTMYVYEPGVHEHTCPGCGNVITFTVPEITC